MTLNVDRGDSVWSTQYILVIAHGRLGDVTLKINYKLFRSFFGKTVVRQKATIKGRALNNGLADLPSRVRHVNAKWQHMAIWLLYCIYDQLSSSTKFNGENYIHLLRKVHFKLLSNIRTMIQSMFCWFSYIFTNNVLYTVISLCHGL